MQGNKNKQTYKTTEEHRNMFRLSSRKSNSNINSDSSRK